MSNVLFELKSVEILQRDRGQSLTLPFDMRVESGQAHLLIGKNGIGKSTLLRALAAGANPRSGLFKGEIYQTMGLRFVLHPQLSAPRFALPLRLVDILSWSGGLSESSNALIEGIEIERSWDSCSGGERQRTLLATVFNRDLFEAKHPTCLLLDEPMNHLDSATQKTVSRIIRHWIDHGNNRAAIVVTHDNLEGLNMISTSLMASGAS